MQQQAVCPSLEKGKYQNHNMSLIDLLVNRARQARACLFSLRHNLECLTVLLLILNALVYGLYFRYAIPQLLAGVSPKYYIYTEWFWTLITYCNHTFDGSFVLYMILTSLSYNWRIGKYALVCLWLLWIFSLLTLIFDFEIDWYYIGFICSVFLIFTLKFFKHVSNR